MSEVSQFSNLTIVQKGNTLTITVKDITADLGLSASGKSHKVADTRGATSAPDSPDVKINLNVYRIVR